MKWSSSAAACRYLLSLAAIASALAGVALSLAWHYAVPRGRIDADPPPPGAPGDTGYFRVYDYQQYVSGPDWWPVGWAAPLSAVIVGVILTSAGSAVARFRRRAITTGHIAGISALAGGVVGAVMAWHSSLHPPALVVRFVADPSFRDYGPTGLPRQEVYGAPPLVDLVDARVLLPVVGAGAGGLAVALSLVVLVLVRKRARRSDA